MTPAARIAAAIEIIDRIVDGAPAEKALTNWARASRFAGSKDRAAIRDHVFDVLRCWRSTEISGGGASGRARLIGLLRLQGQDVATVFTGEGHAPSPLSDAEQKAGQTLSEADLWDVQDWIKDRLQAALGPQAGPVAKALRHRAEVFLRVNTLRTDIAQAQTLLAEDGIDTVPHALSPTALHVTAGARKVSQSQAFAQGWVELQDAASQAVSDMVPLAKGAKVLDYCAGGGGKSLALAARLKRGVIHAHDAAPQRMVDLPKRAKRAGARIEIVTRPKPPYDVVLCDVPCSGSGAWRRSPEGKWRFAPEDLDNLTGLQSEILQQCQSFVASDGVLAYATCSVLTEENDHQIDRFLAHNPKWRLLTKRQLLPQDGGDGFFVAMMTRASNDQEE